MDVRFPEQENPFPKTLAQAIISVVVAFVIGLFLGNGLGALLGTDDSVINTTTYTDIMAAAKLMFADADQTDSYMNTAVTLMDMDGLKLYSNRDHDGMLANYQGTMTDAFTMFDDDVRRSLLEMMNTEDATYGMTTTTGDPIEGLRLWNVAVVDQVVYYYLYYDAAGFVGIAYDHTEQVLAGSKTAMPLTQNAEGETGMWYLIYSLED